MTRQRTGSRGEGFTLIELLIVIGIVGFLMATILIAVDPVKRIQDSRDARRSSEVYSILNAILTKQTDNQSVYDGCCTAGGATIKTQSGSNVQVLVADASGIVCNSPATRPGCGFPMDTSGADTNCVASIRNAFDGAGTATSTGSSAFVNGSGTSFTSQVLVGDTVTSASTGTCTVLSVNSASQISCTNTPSPTFAGPMTTTRDGAGTATSSNTTAYVNGSGTSFSSQVQVFDILQSSSGGSCSVQVVNSNTLITCGNTPSPAFSGSLSWTRNGSGAISSSGSTVTQVAGATFLIQLQAGDVVTNGSDTCTVLTVDSSTQFTCTAPPSPTSFGPFDAWQYTRTISGSATSTGAAPTVFGSGTAFTTAVSVGNVLTSSSGGTCNVSVILSNTQARCSNSPSPAFSSTYTVTKPISGTGTSTTSTGTVNGSGTAFTTEISAGDTLTSSSGGTCTVTTVNTNSQVSCGAAPSPTFAGAYTVSPVNSASIAPDYISSLPTDPAEGTPCGTGSGCTTVGDLAIGTKNSGYYIRRTNGNRIEIGACKPEQAGVINAKR